MARFQTLGPADLEIVTRKQIAQQKSWREVPKNGLAVECCGKNFTVLPNVFPPRGDTRLMINSLDVAPGSSVLDMGTGSGVLAIFAVLRGAVSALAVDLNQNAVRNARVNVERHGLQGSIDVRLSDGFSAIAETEKFETIIANLPGRSEVARDAVEAAQWDSGFETHRAFFAEAPRHLEPGGRILMTKANYPELNDTVELAEQAGFVTEVLARKNPADGDPRTYFVLAFSRRQSSVAPGGN